MVIKNNRISVKEPSCRGLSYFIEASGILCLFLFISVSLKAQKGYSIYQNAEATLIFLSPHDLKTDNKSIGISADFTVILKKNNEPDSVRMNFTISSSEPVMKWISISIRANDSTYNFLSPHRIYQEKKGNKWDSRFQVMMATPAFQKFLKGQLNDPSDSAINFKYDGEIIIAGFNSKEATTIKDFATQVELELLH